MRAQSATAVAAGGMASIHMDVRSIIMKMLLNCKRAYQVYVKVGDRCSPGGDEGVVPGADEKPACHCKIGVNKQHELGLTGSFCIGELE